MKITYERLVCMSESELSELAADAKSRKIVQRVLRDRAKKRHNKGTWRQTNRRQRRRKP